MKSALFGLGLLLSVSLVGAPRAMADDVTEPETKVKFTDTWSNDGLTYGLAGVGVREKMSFDVYACGLYIEKSQGAAAVKSWLDGAGKAYNVNGKVDTEKAKTDQKTFNMIINGNFPRAMWLKMVRSVGGPKIKDGFIESLGKNLDIEAADVKADVEKLATFLSSAEAVKGGEAGARVSVGVDRQQANHDLAPRELDRRDQRSAEVTARAVSRRLR
jgi:hypothetical protein